MTVTRIQSSTQRDKMSQMAEIPLKNNFVNDSIHCAENELGNPTFMNGDISKKYKMNNSLKNYDLVESDNFSCADVSSCSTSGQHAAEENNASDSDDIFDDSSPPNVSRYGRTIRQKVIPDYVVDGNLTSPKNGKGEKSPSKSPPEKSKVQNGKKTPEKIKNSRNSFSPPDDGQNMSPNYTMHKNQTKVYVRKDLIQKKTNKEETANLMRSMFSPVKNANASNSSEASPEKLNHMPIEKIILKKSPKGVFKCTPKKNEIVLKSLNFDSEIYEMYENESLPMPAKTEYFNGALDDIEKACSWEEGEIAWARVGGHPMWPCLITRDPLNGKFVKSKMVGRSALPSYALHVTFFADSGRHSWLLDHFLMKFEGLEEFNRKKNEITPEIRKKDPKFCAAFEVKANKEAKWRSAVSEAEMLFRRPPELREESLLNMSTPWSNSVKKLGKKSKKVKPKRKAEKTENVSLSESLFDSLLLNSNDDDSNYDMEAVSKVRIKKKRKIKGQTNLDKWVWRKNQSNENLSHDDLDDMKHNESSLSSDLVENTANELENSVETETPIKLNRTLSPPTDKTSLNQSECNELKVEYENNIDTEPTNHNSSHEIKTTESQEPKDEMYTHENTKIEVNTPSRKHKKRALNHNVRTEQESEEEPTTSDAGKNAKSDENKLIRKATAKYDDADFQQFLELKRDAFMDENPSLDESEILSYLYRVWEYGESQMLDEMKNSNSVCLVKGMADDILPSPPKKTRKHIAEENDLSHSPSTNRENIPRKRKNIKSYFCGDISDSSNSDSDFIYKKNKEDIDKSSSNNLPKPVVDANFKPKLNDSPNKLENDDDMYMEALKKPKPNIFKGYVREKVCEICECPSNLVKCKGPCQGMFHITCIKKQTEPSPSDNKNTIKRKRKRGRVKGYQVKKLESSESADMSIEDLDGSESLSTSALGAECINNENVKYGLKAVIEPRLDGQIEIPPYHKTSHDLDNLSESFPKNTLNTSLSIRTVDDVVDFEKQISEKIMEMMESETPIDLDNSSMSSYDDCGWNSIQAGQCIIVDAKVLKTNKKVLSPPPESKDSNDTDDAFKCNHCLKFDIPLCFVCKSAVQPNTGSDFRQRCNIIHCHQFYHPECLKAWPQTKYNAGTLSKGSRTAEALSCPRHVCHTCVSDDPQGCKTRFSGDKLARCIRCPATYHSFTQCIPAGTRLITASQIICPKHCDYKAGRIPYHVNTAWCFICARGGMLVCCETCPTSFHAECLNVPLPEGGYICEDCETGRLPLYGELVWVKLGQYRWWPALVLHPSEIPPNINSLPHLSGQFAVRFFGIYDHYWVNSGRVFPYQEGDTGHASSKKSSVDNAFLTAVKQAQKAYDIIKSLKQRGSEDDELVSSLLPPKYVKLKINRPIGGAVIISKSAGEGAPSKCDCNPNLERPCAPESDCLNRMLLTECSPDMCAAGERCCNQAFEKRLYPNLEPSRTAHRGWGLKTLVDIKKGEFVIEYVGEVIDEEEFQRRMARRQEIRDENYYFLTLDKDRMIDAGPKGNAARFMNHSCEPNCETQKWTVNGDIRVGLFALKDIPAGSEVTFNYNLTCAGDDKKKCLCGTKRCAGYIGAKPKQDDPPPKKVRKRKYRRRASSALNNSVVKTIVKARQSLASNNEKAEPLKELQGIDRDVEIIRLSLVEQEGINLRGKARENLSKLGLGDSTTKSNINVKNSFNCEKEAVETKTESILVNSTFEDDLNGEKVKGVKRKRSLKLHLRTKSDTTAIINKTKRTRSNSVQFNDSVILIDQNNLISVIKNETKGVEAEMEKSSFPENPVDDNVSGDIENKQAETSEGSND